MRLAIKAKQMGMKFSPYSVFKDGRRIDGSTEEEIFSVLGEPYLTPEKRN